MEHGQDMEGTKGITGIILAGGRSSRFGSNKALALLEGETLIGRACRVLSSLFDEVIIITNRPEEYDFLAFKKFPDIYPGSGPMSGIHSALKNTGTVAVFTAACDMPLLDERLIRFMAGLFVEEQRRQGPLPAAIIPRFEGRLQPLHAIYTKRALPALEGLLEEERPKMANLAEIAPCRIVPEEDVLAQLDRKRLAAGLHPFRNINRKGELEEIERAILRYRLE
jgi:molybdopterin-guanine dinucleotide biosynthesis protein A